MSYDVLAFDPAATDDAGFAAWWDAQAEWGEGHSYADSAVTTPALRAFYDELRVAFPPLGGPDAAADELLEDPAFAARVADYSIGRALVYGAFRWSVADEARAAFVACALRNGVAVALVSDDGSVIRPTAQPQQ